MQAYRLYYLHYTVCSHVYMGQSWSDGQRSGLVTEELRLSDEAGLAKVPLSIPEAPSMCCPLLLHSASRVCRDGLNAEDISLLTSVCVTNNNFHFTMQSLNDCKYKSELWLCYIEFFEYEYNNYLAISFGLALPRSH